MRILHAGLAEEFVFRRNLPDQIKSEVQYLITCLIRQMKIPERNTANKCDEYTRIYIYIRATERKRLDQIDPIFENAELRSKGARRVKRHNEAHCHR